MLSFRFDVKQRVAGSVERDTFEQEYIKAPEASESGLSGDSGTGEGVVVLKVSDARRMLKIDELRRDGAKGLPRDPQEYASMTVVMDHGWVCSAISASPACPSPHACTCTFCASTLTSILTCLANHFAVAVDAQLLCIDQSRSSLCIHR